MKEFRNPSNVHPPIAAYTHQIELNGSEQLLILSGQVGRREDGNVPENALEQLDLAFENLSCNLQAAQMGIQDIVKITLYLVGEMDPSKRGAIITGRLQNHKPCMTLIYASALANPIYKVEIDAWASKEKGGNQ